MLRKLGRGLFVTELMGQGVNYVTGDYSRRCRLLGRGRAHRFPVHEITIAGNLKQMFQDIAAVGADVHTQGSKVHRLGIDLAHETRRQLSPRIEGFGAGSARVNTTRPSRGAILKNSARLITPFVDRRPIHGAS